MHFEMIHKENGNKSAKELLHIEKRYMKRLQSRMMRTEALIYIMGKCSNVVLNSFKSYCNENTKQR